MRTPPLLRQLARSLRSWNGREVVLLILVGIILIAVAVYRSGTPADAQSAGGGSDSPELGRACTSDGTIFANLWSVDALADLFREKASLITEERLTILKTPSSWVCPQSLSASSSPPMPALEGLALQLPGWSYEYRIPILGSTILRTIRKPVTFENFASILSELRREYECRLGELQEHVDTALLKNKDIEPVGTTFCCGTSEKSCVPVGPDVTCTGSISTDSQCGGACEVVLRDIDIALRREPFINRLEEEKVRARVAVDRTMLTIRSLETHYAYARELLCYARVSLDLRNALNLLGESVSCMPKIWDAVTSLHDPAS